MRRRRGSLLKLMKRFILKSQVGIEKLTERTIVILARAAITGISIFLLLISLLHILRPDLPLNSHFISEYGLGPYRVILAIAFSALIIGGAAMNAGLRLAFNNQTPGATVVLTIWIVAMILCMVFPTDPLGIIQSWIGAIHNVAATLAFISLNGAVVLYARVFRQHKEWAHLAIASYGPAVAAVLLLTILGGYYIANFSIREWVGINERVLICVLLSWLLLVAGQLERGLKIDA
jgi:Protein of unknown function (DUF998)